MAIYTEKTVDKKTGKKIDKLVDGKKVYYIRTYITDENGNSKQITRHNKKWLGREGEKEALSEEIRLRNSGCIKNEIIQKQNITINELKNLYLSSKRNKVDTDTLNTIESRLNHFCEIDKSNQVNNYPKMKVVSYSKNLYQTWQHQMKNKTYKKGKKQCIYSIRQLNNIHNEICRMFDFGVTESYINSNIVRQVGKIGSPKEIRISKKNVKYEVINYDEYCRLYDVSKNNLKYNTIFELWFTRGPRPGEMRAFRCVDFDYENLKLSVNHTMSKKNVLKEPKTASSKADIYLEKGLAEKIKLLIDELKKDSSFNENWYIFGSDTPISSNALEYNKNKYFKLAGINNHIRLHDFRHSCATWLFSIGIPITAISKILRHANVNETLKTYTHLFDKDYENALSTIFKWKKKV